MLTRDTKVVQAFRKILKRGYTDRHHPLEVFAGPDIWHSSMNTWDIEKEDLEGPARRSRFTGRRPDLSRENS